MIMMNKKVGTMMRITCFADEISPLLADQLRIMEECGIRWMEIRSAWDIGVLQMTQHQLRDIRMLAAERGIGVSCISTPIGKEPLDSPLKNVLERLKRAAEAAHICGCGYVRMFSFHRAGWEEGEALKRAAERLERMAEMAKAEDVVLVMENAPPTVGCTGRNCAELLKKVGSPYLRLAFDGASAVEAGERPFDETFPQVENLISYVHIKDHAEGLRVRVPAGEGDAQIPDFLNALRDREDLFVSLEPHLSYAGPCGGFSGEEPFRRAHRALISILEDLQIPY